MEGNQEVKEDGLEVQAEGQEAHGAHQEGPEVQGAHLDGQGVHVGDHEVQPGGPGVLQVEGDGEALEEEDHPPTPLTEDLAHLQYRGHHGVHHLKLLVTGKVVGHERPVTQEAQGGGGPQPLHLDLNLS